MAFERDCMSDRIRRVLADRIITGQLAPGERLVEMRIAEEFRTSQAPVREALRELETLRLVESEPYRGTRVREVGPREMVEANSIRGALEHFAAETAAEILRSGSCELRATLTRLHDAARANSHDDYAHFDTEFHRGIVAAAGNRILLQTWDSLGFETRVKMMLARYNPDLSQVVYQHDTILDALEAGDGVLAGKLLRDHASTINRLVNEAEARGSEPHA